MYIIYVVACNFLVYVLMADTRSFAIFTERVELGVRLWHDSPFFWCL